jgi:hypothetical protein
MNGTRTIGLSLLLAAFLISTQAGCGSGNGNNSTPSADAAPTDSSWNLGDSGAPSGTGNASLSWTAPVTNEDGSSLTDLAGYRVYYGTAPGSYSSSFTVPAGTTYTVSGLASGTYYFAVTAYNSAGIESTYSNEVTKTL